MENDATEKPPEDRREAALRILYETLRSEGYDIKDGTRVFRHPIICDFGNVVIDFELTAFFIDWALETSDLIITDSFEKATQPLAGLDVHIRVPYGEVPADIAGFLAFLAMVGMRSKIRSALYELTEETETIFKGIIAEAMKSSESTEPIGLAIPNMKVAIKAVVKTFADDRKAYLTKSIAVFSSAPRLEQLPEIYPDLLKVWQSVKKIYQDHGENETWRDMVKVKFPELIFDSDLLTRITGKLEDLSEDIRTKLADTDGDHTPSTIALEHAARVCGAAHYQYGTRYLHRLKSGGSKTEQIETE